VTILEIKAEKWAGGIAQLSTRRVLLSNVDSIPSTAKINK
jgi:hypothetical protein